MGDLLEILELPLEVYPEYWAGLRSLVREAPLWAAGYAVVAPVAAVLFVRWLLKGAITFKRAYRVCLALALLVLPGAVANGGLAVFPLAFIVAFCFIEPILLPYNAMMFALAALVAWVAAHLVCRVSGPPSSITREPA